jgi:hypothetical protein
LSNPIPLCIDVTRAAAMGEDCGLGTLLFVPSKICKPSILCVMFPGGTYTKAYHHLVVPGRSGYSAAEFLAEKGIIVAIVDHLGTGESTFPRDGKRVGLEVMARADAQAAEWLRENAKRGTLHPDLPPLPDARVAGFGHSLGGYLLQIAQGEFGAFDAIALAGSTCQAMVSPTGDGTLQRELKPSNSDGYILMPRAQNHRSFYYPDVPADVIAADDLSFSPLPEGMLDIGIPGRTTDYVAKISCPVFLAFGEIDLSPDPLREPAFYSQSNDISLFRLSQSAHCHNSASTRLQLWRRHHQWLRTVLD